MNRAQRRAKAREHRLVSFVHTCDFSGGTRCNNCGKTVTAEEIPALVRERMAKFDLNPELGVGHDQVRLTQEEQIAAISERVIERSLAANRIEGRAVIRRKK